MPRATKDARLDTAAARARLPARKKPHYRLIDTGLHLGYYRGAKASGTWIARRYTGAGSYETQRLGLADDGRRADGATVLTFAQGQTKAREWATQQGSAAAGVAEQPWTVADAIEHYLADYAARGGKARRMTEITFDAHVADDMRKRQLTELTPSIIRSWHRRLATASARLRTSATAISRKTRTVAADDHDALRARRATANRILTQLKAALNLAYREGKVASDDAWRRVSPFPKVDAAHVRYLTDDEAVRLVNACPNDLRTLVTAALLTGCRYQEVAKLQAADVDLNASVLLIRAPKGGEARHVVLTDEARQFLEQQMAGKTRSGLLFEHVLVTKQATKDALAETVLAPWGRSHQFRPLREACKAAKITPAVSFHILRHTHASRLAMKGVPMAVIAAQLGHKDTKITAKHYAHLSPGYVADTIRAAFGRLGLVPESNVVGLRSAASA